MKTAAQQKCLLETYAGDGTVPKFLPASPGVSRPVSPWDGVSSSQGPGDTIMVQFELKKIDKFSSPHKRSPYPI